ncbi:MAG: gliding motility-associated C-terminal domain-containing protein [Saprospiraceae bacterium]|nr:gliding motility-associated C-terminal domain-containing protein [Saprospiraceae bacterium]
MQLRYFLPTALLGLSSLLSAQTGSFDTRLSLKNLDCKTGKADVQVEVKAHSDKEVFLMADANYRFEFEANKLQNPTLKSQDNFSNQAPKRQRSYGVHNLQGSQKRDKAGIVSLNTFYNGTNADAEPVTTEWKSVATVSFDIADFRSPSELKWHDNHTFPTTGMSQLKVTNDDPTAFEYDLDGVKAGGSFANLTINPAAQCRNAAPTVAATPVRTKMDESVEAIFPIYDADEGDKFSVSLVSTSSGKLTPSVIGTNLVTQFTPEAGFVGDVDAKVEVKDKFGNTDIVALRIVVKKDALMVFNAFSPNNDGVNDVLTVEGLEKNKVTTLSVFDAKGREVYQTQNYKNDWNGTKEGRHLPEGTYFYTFADGSGQNYTGYIQLNR